MPSTSPSNFPSRLRPSLGLVAVALSGTFGCKAHHHAPAPFRVDVVVESDPRVPISDVTVVRSGTDVGKTDSSGRARLLLSGAQGDVVSLSLRCPENFETPQEPITFSLLRLAGTQRAPEYRARCAPATRSVVVAVRALNGPHVPVVHRGREIGRTDSEGVAHVVVQRKPGESFRLELDTSGQDTLRPRNPSEFFRVADRDDVQVFKQRFRVSKPKPRRAVIRERSVPQRL